jgi:predicted DNA-binding protein (UPF0251 family)
MFDQLPSCFQQQRQQEKTRRIDQVLEIVRENPAISLNDLRGLVSERLGFARSTAYDYLRRAKEKLKQGLVNQASL